MRNWELAQNQGMPSGHVSSEDARRVCSSCDIAVHLCIKLKHNCLPHPHTVAYPGSYHPYSHFSSIEGPNCLLLVGTVSFLTSHQSPNPPCCPHPEAASSLLEP